MSNKEKIVISVLFMILIVFSMLHIAWVLNWQIQTWQEAYDKEHEIVTILRENSQMISYENTILIEKQTDYHDTLFRLAKYFYSMEEQIGGAVIGESIDPSSENLVQAIENSASSFTTIVLSVENYYNYKEKTSSIVPNTLPLLPSPYNRITSSFGVRWNPMSGKLEYHRGIDLASYYHAEVVATADGIVDEIWTNHPVFGKAIQIRHPSGYYSFYAHLSVFYANKGEEVQQGRIIGRTGRSGEVTGEHIHYQVSKSGELINPILLLNYNLISTEENYAKKVIDSD